MDVSRRNLLRLNLSEDNCPTQEDVLGQLAPGKADEDKLLYWIDGFHLKNVAQDGFYTPPQSRASLQILIREPQTANRWVDRVVLAQSQQDGDQVSNLRVYQQHEKMPISGFPPYAIFHNLNLTGNWKIYYRIVEGTKQHVYRTGTINTPDMTRINSNMLFLPSILRNDLASSRFRGLFSSVYRLSPTAIQQQNLMEPYLKSVQPNGYFVVEVDHSPLPEHHIEMIFVTDPVGRLLGARQGPFPGPRTQIAAMTQQQMDSFRLNSQDIANIHECPHIQVFAWNKHNDPDKSQEGRLFRSTIWLR
ncbi:MAG: hypothetical protein AB8C84_05205 [Oligoflexales bacterium]